MAVSNATVIRHLFNVVNNVALDEGSKNLVNNTSKFENPFDDTDNPFLAVPTGNKPYNWFEVVNNSSATLLLRIDGSVREGFVIPPNAVFTKRREDNVHFHFFEVEVDANLVNDRELYISGGYA
jgi:hypothetical protein